MGALVGVIPPALSLRLIRHLGVTPLIHQFGETVIANERGRLVKPSTAFPALF